MAFYLDTFKKLLHDTNLQFCWWIHLVLKFVCLCLIQNFCPSLIPRAILLRYIAINKWLNVEDSVLVSKLEGYKRQGNINYMVCGHLFFHPFSIYQIVILGEEAKPSLGTGFTKPIMLNTTSLWDCEKYCSIIYKLPSINYWFITTWIN